MGTMADQSAAEALGVVADSVIIYPLTPTLSVAVKEVTEIVREVALEGMIKAVTVGVCVSVAPPVIV